MRDNSLRNSGEYQMGHGQLIGIPSIDNLGYADETICETTETEEGNVHGVSTKDLHGEFRALNDKLDTGYEIQVIPMNNN